MQDTKEEMLKQLSNCFLGDFTHIVQLITWGDHDFTLEITLVGITYLSQVDLVILNHILDFLMHVYLTSTDVQNQNTNFHTASFT